MTHRTIRGVMHVTLAVPFAATDWIEDDETADVVAWVDGVNDGSLPDAMEGAIILPASAIDHEVVAWEIESAYYEPETHVSEEADR